MDLLDGLMSIFEVDWISYNQNLCFWPSQGSPSSPANEVELTTAPSIDNSTHWGQQVFLLHPPMRVMRDDVLEGTFSMTRSKENHRLMDVQFVYKSKLSSGEATDPVTKFFCIE